MIVNMPQTIIVHTIPILSLKKSISDKANIGNIKTLVLSDFLISRTYQISLCAEHADTNAEVV